MIDLNLLKGVIIYYRLAMAMGLSFTALTLVAEYSMVSDWVNGEDWSALLDVVPTMEIALLPYC